MAPVWCLEGDWEGSLAAVVNKEFIKIRTLIYGLSKRRGRSWARKVMFSYFQIISRMLSCYKSKKRRGKMRKRRKKEENLKIGTWKNMKSLCFPDRSWTTDGSGVFSFAGRPPFIVTFLSVCWNNVIFCFTHHRLYKYIVIKESITRLTWSHLFTLPTNKTWMQIWFARFCMVW